MNSLEDIFTFRDYVEPSEFNNPRDHDLYGTMGDLEQIGKEFEICNAFAPFQTVRKIKIEDEVCIDFMGKDQQYCFPKKTPIYYEPWSMDRGSYVFWTDIIDGYGKLATQFDPVKKKCLYL